MVNVYLNLNLNLFILIIFNFLVKESIKKREKMYWKVGSGKEGERRKVKQRINQGKERKQKG